MLRKTLLVLIFFSWAPMLSGQSDATKKEPDIYNFLRLNEKYCTGGQPRVEELSKLKATGTRAIVNLRRPSEFDEAGEVAEALRVGMRSQTVKDFARSYIARRYIERYIERQGN